MKILFQIGEDKMAIDSSFIREMANPKQYKTEISLLKGRKFDGAFRFRDEVIPIRLFQGIKPENKDAVHLIVKSGNEQYSVLVSQVFGVVSDDAVEFKSVCLNDENITILKHQDGMFPLITPDFFKGK